MIDEKVAQTVSQTSSMAVCCICQAKPHKMNNLETVRSKPENVHLLNLGICIAALLPIGILTKEAQEARNKDYRVFRQKQSRKCSRTLTNEDVIERIATVN
ncbi:unnamed protein product [Euphydryas editha]|uniref:Uncharacterized protein n=1 Tax=Euphydryas editha TaxID=104508 RepID=A0AAU9TGU1_EUPED|nr:unnamed protein product [Euphydryas editha]